MKHYFLLVNVFFNLSHSPSPIGFVYKAIKLNKLVHASGITDIITATENDF